MSTVENLGADSRVRDEVSSRLRWSLISGSYRPGDKIKLRNIASEFGFSVTPVREALAQLVASGALEQTPQRSICIPKLSAARYGEVRRLRLLLEPGLAMRAACLMEASDINNLQEIAEQLLDRENLSSADYCRGVAQFHFTLYACAAQPCTLRLVETLWLQSGPYLTYLFPDYMKISVGPQLRLLVCEALRRRDAVTVGELMEEDLRRATSYLLNSIERLEA